MEKFNPLIIQSFVLKGRMMHITSGDVIFSRPVCTCTKSRTRFHSSVAEWIFLILLRVCRVQRNSFDVTILYISLISAAPFWSFSFFLFFYFQVLLKALPNVQFRAGLMKIGLNILLAQVLLQPPLSLGG